MSAQSPTPLLIGLGEAMMRLSPPHRAPLVHASGLDVHIGGAEINVLLTSSALGVPGRFLTRLPSNRLGELVRRHARANGVEVLAHEETGGRLGLYFLEMGVPPRPSTVLYDRTDSAASHLSASEFDWMAVLSEASAVHTTGITCALGQAPFQAVMSMLSTARQLGVMTSFDLNYRSHLWRIDEARTCLEMVLPLVDTLFVSPSDLSLLCGRTGEVDTMIEAVTRDFSISTMVIRERLEVSTSELGARVRVEGATSTSAEAIGVVVDEIGAGDAAAGAFLASLLVNEPLDVAAERSARAYARMVTIPGDAWTGSLYDLSDGFPETRTVDR